MKLRNFFCVVVFLALTSLLFSCNKIENSPTYCNNKQVKNRLIEIIDEDINVGIKISGYPQYSKYFKNPKLVEYNPLIQNVIVTDYDEITKSFECKAEFKLGDGVSRVEYATKKIIDSNMIDVTVTDADDNLALLYLIHTFKKMASLARKCDDKAVFNDIKNKISKSDNGNLLNFISNFKLETVKSEDLPFLNNGIFPTINEVPGLKCEAELVGIKGEKTLRIPISYKSLIDTVGEFSVDLDLDSFRTNALKEIALLARKCDDEAVFNDIKNKSSKMNLINFISNAKLESVKSEDWIGNYREKAGFKCEAELVGVKGEKPFRFPISYYSLINFKGEFYVEPYSLNSETKDRVPLARKCDDETVFNDIKNEIGKSGNVNVINFLDNAKLESVESEEYLNDYYSEKEAGFKCNAKLVGLKGKETCGISIYYGSLINTKGEFSVYLKEKDYLNARIEKYCILTE